MTCLSIGKDYRCITSAISDLINPNNQGFNIVIIVDSRTKQELFINEIIALLHTIYKIVCLNHYDYSIEYNTNTIMIVNIEE